MREITTTTPPSFVSSDEEHSSSDELFFPTELPQGPYYPPDYGPPREQIMSISARYRAALSLSGQISATSLVNSLSDSTKVYLIAFGGESAVAAVTVMSIVEWCPTILGATFQAVATLTAGISHLSEDHPTERPRPSLLGPNAGGSNLNYEMINPQLQNVGQIFRDGLKWAGIFSVPMMGMFFFSGDILTALGQPADIVPLAQTYCRANLIGIPAYLGSLVCAQFANATGKSHVVFGIQILSAVAGNGLGYLLGVHFFGPNLWGVGIGIATQYWISFGAMLTYFRLNSARDSLMRSYRLFDLGANTTPYFKKVLSVGWGVSFFYGFELGTLFTTIAWVGEKLGAKGLATQGVIQTWAFLLIVPAYAIGESANILVARYHSLGRFTDMRSLGHINAFLGGIYGLAFLLLFEIWPEGPIRLIIGSGNPQLVADTAYVARFAAPAFFLDPIRIIYSGADRGLERTLMTVVSSIVGLGLIGLSSSYFLSYVIDLGLVGTALGRNIGLLVPLVWMQTSFVYGAATASGVSTGITRFFDSAWCCGRRRNATPLYESEHSFFRAHEAGETRVLVLQEEANDPEQDIPLIPLHSDSHTPATQGGREYNNDDEITEAGEDNNPHDDEVVACTIC